MLITLDPLLTPQELATVLGAIAEARFDDGAATAGHIARGVKHNLQAIGDQPELVRAREVVVDALMRNEDFRERCLPLRVLPPMFSRYEPGMAYGEHTDNAFMGRNPSVRTDLSVTLFLADPASYEGGALSIGVDGVPRSIRLPPGSAVVYPSGTLHEVEPVTRGTRVAAVTWVQSVIRDGAQRELLSDVSVALRELRARAPHARETLLLAKTRANLMRMWAEN